MGFVDKAVKKIRPRDRELSDIQDNLGNTLQQVLDHLNTTSPTGEQKTLNPVLKQNAPNTAYTVKTPALTIRGRIDGPFQIDQPTIIFGDAATTNAQNSMTPQKDACLFSYGQIVAFGSAVQTDGFVLIPQVPGPAFRIAPNNASTCFSVGFDGSTTIAGSLATAAGIKSWLPAMFYWNTSYPGGIQPLLVALVNGSAVGSTPWGQPVLRSGSIVGITAYQSAAINPTCTVYILKNGAQVYSAPLTSGSATGSVAIPKGTVPFIQGDVLTAQISYTQAGINLCTQVAIQVEEVS